MYFRKFFNTDEGGEGGAVAAVEEQNQNGESAAPKVDPPPPENASIPLSQLNAWGFKSIEEMNAHFEKRAAPEPTEEEKQKALEIENAEIRAYAIKNGHMKEDDLKRYDRVTTTADRDLVFADYFNEFKEANPEIEADEIEDAAKEAFDGEYRTASEKRFKREADLLRRESIESYNKVKEDYKDDVKWEGGKTKWTQFVAKTIEEALPGDDLEFFSGKDGDDEIKIKIPLTKEEKAEVAKQVLTPRRYAQFLEGKVEDVEKILKERVVSAAQQKYLTKAIEKSIEEGIKIGKSRGSYVGAVHPFPIASRANEAVQVDASVGDALKQVRESYKNLKQARGG